MRLAFLAMFAQFCECCLFAIPAEAKFSSYSLLANITRCFFWLGNHFELALLYQSLFMIAAQVRFYTERPDAN